MFLTILCDCICISKHCILYRKIQDVILRWNMTHCICCCDDYLGLILKNLHMRANHFGPAINYRTHILGYSMFRCKFSAMMYIAKDQITYSQLHLYLGSDFWILGQAKPMSRRKHLPLGMAFLEGYGQHWNCLSIIDNMPAAREHL